MNESIYLSEVKQFIKGVRQGLIPCRKHKLGLGFSKVEAGICSLYQWTTVPLLVVQDNPNFKAKIFAGSVPLFTWKKAAIRQILSERYHHSTDRRSRIYINVGSLPFFDNRSGIPRVAKELTRHGLVSTACEVYPVYADPVDGTYKYAAWWARNLGACINRFKALNAYDSIQDPVIDFAPGDWLIHTMINPNEVDVEAEQFVQMRAAGVKIGFILHDIIAERHPEFFKNRDAKNFSRWLKNLPQVDGVFAVSQATLEDYRAWLNEKGLAEGLQQVQGWFHLGCDFQSTASIQKVDPEISATLSGKKYVLQVSTIEPRKGYAQLLAAFEELWAAGSTESLVIVGRKGWKVTAFCRRLRRHSEFGKRLFWLQGINDATLKALYEGASLVVAASEAEGFGLSVVEAAACKRPQLVRDIPSFREVAPEGTAFFCGSEPANLARAISSVNRTQVPSTSNRPKSWKESAEDLFSLIKRTNK